MKIIETSIKRRVTIGMFTLAILLFGYVSFTRLKINLLPELSYPTLTIRTEYTGAAPAEIENLISKPVEETVGIVKNVKKVNSISRTGQSDVLLEFNWGTKMDYAILEVREKLDSLQLPLEVKRPTLLRFDPSLDPVIRLGFFIKSNTNKSDQQTTYLQEFDEDKLKYLRRFADEQIKKELESVLGVAAVKVSGGLEDEIQVNIDQGKLAQLGIPIEEVGRILGAENVNLSGGRLKEGNQQFLVRTLNQFASVEEIGNVIILSSGGSPVYLKDIAEVRHGYRERSEVIRFEGSEAVEIAIYKEGDANTVAVGREVGQRLDKIRAVLPPGYQLIKVYDQSIFIKQAVDEVVKAAFIGGILAILILYFFLNNFATTVIISLSIPVSVIATFNLMYGFDLSLNIMSLGGIALGIGMLVDNSIVVLENISRHKQLGKDTIQASLDGAREVGGAVTASTLTSIAVFFPLVFVQGIAGQLFRDQALTITFALIASLVVALTLIPMLASIRGRKIEIMRRDPEATRSGPKKGIRGLIYLTRVFIFTKIPVFIFSIIFRIVGAAAALMSFILRLPIKWFNSAYNKVESIYPKLLNLAMSNKLMVLGIAAGLFLFSIFLIPKLGIELIPQLSQGEFRIEFRLPPGTPIYKTDQVIKSVHEKSKNINNIQTIFSVSGSGNRMDANPETGGENWGEMSVVVARDLKKIGEDSVMKEIRNNLETIPGLQYKFFRPTLFTFKTPVEIEIAGYNLKKLKQISDKLVKALSASDRFADIKSSVQAGYPEIQIRFNREKAAKLGLPIYLIADRIVNKVRGNVASKYSWHDRKIDILVRTSEQDRSSIEKIRNLIINPESKRPVTLGSVADVVVDTGPAEIRRIDQERVALISANLSFGDLGAAAQEIQSVISSIKLPDDMTINLGGQNQEMTLSFSSLKFALLMAVFLVYLVMASLFESLLHPFVILLTIPLALIGAVFSLWLTGSAISVVVFIGLILLAGIVVNNAIVLIDLINKLRTKGMAKTEAIIQGGKSRLRPIVMTMLTTTLGLLPMAIGLGEGAEVRAPMAITVIGGLTVSTLLTLIVIPVVYTLIDRKE